MLLGKHSPTFGGNDRKGNDNIITTRILAAGASHALLEAVQTIGTVGLAVARRLGLRGTAILAAIHAVYMVIVNKYMSTANENYE